MSTRMSQFEERWCNNYVFLNVLYRPEAGGQFEPGRRAAWSHSKARHISMLNPFTMPLYTFSLTYNKDFKEYSVF